MDVGRALVSASRMSQRKMPKAKRKAVQVVLTINVAQCITALTGLLYGLHKIGLV